ncbi:hypothetical protein [Rhizobium sp. AG207R]|uniref:hypothetical protein n=1 Tax=Rhizobium sp. AG207R TaxID=2802287 RepID=UPI0022AC275F|nr:hypothetical protein [Rhizobium sp. AG207R]MCZ3378631.1 hypothetical protein [Rhizobium sp. AG207R]
MYLTITSYPPGDEADEAQLAEFRKTIAEAFEVGDSVHETEKETVLSLAARKAESSPRYFASSANCDFTIGAP